MTVPLNPATSVPFLAGCSSSPASVRGSIAVIGGTSALIGLWSAACFVGAMISDSGPLGLAGS